MLEQKHKNFYRLIQGDCLDILPRLDDESVDLIIVDSPYNIGKDDWDRISNYLGWCKKWLIHVERVLKSNGSFYLFHVDMPTIAKLMVLIDGETKFKFKQFIVWNKKFKGSSKEGYLQGFLEVEEKRNYSTMAEYLLFYTFPDEDYVSKAFKNSVRAYFQNELSKFGTMTEINNLFRRKGWCAGQSTFAQQFFGDNKKMRFPTKQVYTQLQTTGYFQRNYDDLKREFEISKRKCKSSRYIFNNQKTHHSVWNFEIPQKTTHTTPKPLPLIETILLHSSNENDVVLDPFMGSGTTMEACQHLERSCIGVEINPEFCEIIKKRCFGRSFLDREVEYKNEVYGE